MIKIIDTHTHLDAEEFDEDRAEAFARAREAGVGKVFLPAIDVKTTKAVLSLSHQYPGYAYPMIGLHPEEVKADWKEQLAELRQILDEHRVQINTTVSDFIAIGEVGLDYYWSREFEHEQLQAFEEQVKWSVETRLPLMIHCRRRRTRWFISCALTRKSCREASFIVSRAISARQRNCCFRPFRVGSRRCLHFQEQSSARRPSCCGSASSPCT